MQGVRRPIERSEAHRRRIKTQEDAYTHIFICEVTRGILPT
jgi:hypothetical protein